MLDFCCSSGKVGAACGVDTVKALRSVPPADEGTVDPSGTADKDDGSELTG